MDITKNIIFYDGDCGLCNTSVQQVLKYQKQKFPFYFVPLQQEEAQTFLAQHGIDVKMDTLYYWNGYKITERSTAVLSIARHLKYPAHLLFYGFIFPKAVRNCVYDYIAQRRHIFFRKNRCRIPEENEKKFFLHQ